MAVEANDVLATPHPAGGEVYAIKETLFDNTYHADDRQRHMPTQEDMLTEWAVVLQNEVLYRKTDDVVFAKNDDDKDAKGEDDGDLVIDVAISWSR